MTLAFIIILVHLSIGAATASVRWTRFTRREREYYHSNRNTYLRGDEMTSFREQGWRDVVSGDERLSQFPPQAQDHVGWLATNVFLWFIPLLAQIPVVRGIFGTR